MQKTQNLLDKTDIRPMVDHVDLLQHIYRNWTEEADRLTHEAREKGACWNFFTVKEGSKIEAVRAKIDGRVSRQVDRKDMHKVGSAYVIQTLERIEEAAEKMEWTTKIEVAEVLSDDATITQAETAAAVEAAKADQIIFGWEDTEERHKRRRDDKNFSRS